MRNRAMNIYDVVWPSPLPFIDSCGLGRKASVTILKTPRAGHQLGECSKVREKLLGHPLRDAAKSSRLVSRSAQV